MKKKKSFDCVQMKRQIQKQLQQEVAGSDDAQAHRQQMEKVSRNPVLREYVRTLRKTAFHRESRQSK